MLGRSVGNYGVVSKIGEGGMGIVYLARHATLDRRVAIKVLRPALSSNQDIVSRFFDEAKAATAVQNPGIIEVYDCGFLEDRTAYIIMEYLDGESLASRLRRGRGTIYWTLLVIRGIARALQAAHDKGIIHRDLKPDNVFLVPGLEASSDERIKLLDFGIAKLTFAGDDAGRTTTGVVMGTPAYMAPEQCRGDRSVDHRADLYSLGCVAYEMLCGQPPFVADGSADVIAHHLCFDPVSLRSYVSEIPDQVQEIVLRLLKKEPRGRYGSAAELIRALDAVAKIVPNDLITASSTLTLTHNDSQRTETTATRSDRVTADGIATLPLATQTTLSGAATSGKPGRDEKHVRRGIATLAAAIAIAFVVLVFVFGRLLRPASAPSFIDSDEPDGTAPSMEHSQEPARLFIVPIPGDAGTVDDAAGTMGFKRGLRFAEAPYDVPSPAISLGVNSSSTPAEERASGDAATSSVGSASTDARPSDASEVIGMAKGLTVRSNSPRSRAGAAPRTVPNPAESVGRTVGTNLGSDTSAGQGTTPVAPGPGLAEPAAPLEECSPASFSGVLDAKAPSKKAIKDARSRLARCKPSMDPGVYDDLYRRFIELL